MSIDQFLRKPVCFGEVDGVIYEDRDRYFEAIAAKETEAIDNFCAYMEENRDLLMHVARQGDGEGGRLVQILKQTLFGAHEDQKSVYRKKKIPDRLRTAVMERDEYRCVRCGTHRDLCADHIFPEVLGGEATLENLQTLCRPCNTSKGGRAEVFV